MDQEEALPLLALLWCKILIVRWENEMIKGTLLLDEEKASALFPWLLSGIFEDELLEEELGLSAVLIQQLRRMYCN